MKIMTLLILGILAIPYVTANTYGTGRYGCGLYGVGCEEIAEAIEPVAGAGATGAEGARGGGCWVYARNLRDCYSQDPETNECVNKCPANYTCDTAYDWDLVTPENNLEFCIPIGKIGEKLEKGKITVGLLVLISMLLLVLYINENVKKLKKIKKGKNKEEENVVR